MVHLDSIVPQTVSIRGTLSRSPLPRPDAPVSAVPAVGAVLRQHLCTACGHVVHVPTGVRVPCGWCSAPLVQVDVAGVPVARDKEYASYLG